MSGRALLVRDGDDARVLLSPAVGWWADGPADGALLSAGSAAGRLIVLGDALSLVVPVGIEGRVVRSRAPGRLAVGYGEMLFELHPVEAGAGGRAVEAGRSAAGREGGLALPSPTDGVFYRAAGPDRAPFAEPGDTLEPGRPLGLIEVMKTFNQVLYGGAGLPKRARLLEFCCESGAEVRAGDPLVRLEPLDV